MKIAITVYADSAVEAEMIISAMQKIDGAGKFLMASKEAVPQKVAPWSDTGVEPAEPAESEPKPRPNVCPGKPGIGKIGGSTKDSLLTELGMGMQPTDKYAEHMKLLWERGEVKYDGKEYYL